MYVGKYERCKASDEKRDQAIRDRRRSEEITLAKKEALQSKASKTRIDGQKHRQCSGGKHILTKESECRIHLPYAEIGIPFPCRLHDVFVCSRPGCNYVCVQEPKSTHVYGLD